MDGRRLRYFLAVAEEQHFHAAAERLHVAQSALSRQIRALEDEIGVRLFDRHARGTRLTPAGSLFRAEASAALHAYETAVSRAQAVARGRAEEIRVAVNEVTARNPQVIAALRAFRAAHPEVRVTLVFLHSQQQIEQIYGGQIDVGFMFHAPADRRLLAWHEVDVDAYALLLPEGHRLAAAARVTMDMLERESFIIQSRALNRYYYDLVFARMLARGITPDIVQEATSEAAMISLVALGLGISVVHGSNRVRTLPGVVIRPIDDLSVPLDLKAVWKRSSRSGPVRLLADTLARMPPA